MQLLRLRRWSRAVAIVLLAAALPGLSHLAEDDVACLLPAEGMDVHDTTTHGIRPAGAQPSQEHCAICHWARWLRAPRPAAADVGHVLLTSSPISLAHESAELTVALDRTPARAPPPVTHS